MTTATGATPTRKRTIRRDAGRNMTNEEMAAEAREHGDQAFLTLWAQVKGFAYWIGKRYAGIDQDDARQAAQEALLLTVRDYDPETGPFLTAYKYALFRAFQIAKWGGRGERIKRDPIHSADSLNAPAAEDSETELWELIPGELDTDATAENRERDAAVHAALETLPEGERAVILCIFFHGMTQDAAAAYLQTSAAEVRKTEAAALRRLRHPDISRTLRNYL